MAAGGAEQEQPPFQCPVNFNRLTLGALRKYQYRFRLRMGAHDKPLLTRTDLIDAISRHFVLEMKVDPNDEIGKFLSLKREETRTDLTLPGRPKPRQTRLRAPKPTLAAPASAAAGLNSNAPKQAANPAKGAQQGAGGKQGTGIQNNSGGSTIISTTGKRSTAVATATPISTAAPTDSK